MNRHPFLIFLSCLAIGLVFTSTAQAAKFQSFGSSRILMTNVSGLTCAMQYGPLILIPANISPPGLFGIRYGKSAPTAGGQILGLYTLVPDLQTCYTQSTPSSPFPVFMVNPLNYGVSK